MEKLSDVIDRVLAGLRPAATEDREPPEGTPAESRRTGPSAQAERFNEFSSAYGAAGSGVGVKR